MKDYLIYIIIHQHWDPAWISQRKHTLPQLVILFEDILSKMKKSPSYKFTLDGQTHIIEDYLKQLPKKEANLKKKELSKYVGEGRLLVGPFYSQVDWNLPSEELLLRNLLIGHQEAKEFGKVMKCGWVIDVFGFPEATVRILKGFDIDSVFLSRGIGIKKDKVREAYWWKAANKEKILCIHLIESYRNLMELSATPDIAKPRIESKAKSLFPYSVTKKAVLLFDGYENQTLADDIAPLIAKINQEEGKERVIISTPQEYKDVILKSRASLSEIKGYLNSGKYIASLQGVLSSRIYLKQRQELSQRLLERYLEPYETLYWLLGGRYPKDLLRGLWKELLKVSAHDEVCGCSVDEVHRDTLLVYNQIERAAKAELKKTLRKIAQQINTTNLKDRFALVVFNPLPYYQKKTLVSTKVELPLSALRGLCLIDGSNNLIPLQTGKKKSKKVEIHFEAKEIPPVGYRLYTLRREKKRIRTKLRVSEEEKIMENDYLKVKINDDGTLTLEDKVTARVYPNLGYFKSEGDRGDLYTASVIKDKVTNSLGVKVYPARSQASNGAKISLFESGPLFACFKIEQRLKIPAGLSKDRKRRSKELVECPVITYLRMTHSSPRVDFITKINNLAKDHRLRVCFPTGIQTSYHYIKHKFDLIKVPNKVDGSAYCSQRAPLKGILSPAWDTLSPDGFSHDGLIDVSDKEGGLALMSYALPEYRITTRDNTLQFLNSPTPQLSNSSTLQLSNSSTLQPSNQETIELTLIRAVGWLGLDDLPVRQGRAGWKVRVPEAQCRGKYVFHYALFPHQGSWFKAKLPQELLSHHLNLRVLKTDSHPGRLPPQLGLIRLKSDPEGSLELTAIKRAEDSEDLIVRFYNLLKEKVKYRIKIAGEVKSAYLANLNEETKSKLLLKRGAIIGEAKGKEIVTVRIKVKRKDITFCNPTEFTQLLPQAWGKEERERLLEQALVTKEVVSEEKERVKSDIRSLTRAKDELKKVEKKFGGLRAPAYRLKIEKARMKVFEAIETLQDAQYSLLLTKMRYFEADLKDLTMKREKIKSIQEKIDKMAKGLILPRARRQREQFILDYYQDLNI